MSFSDIVFTASHHSHFIRQDQSSINDLGLDLPLRLHGQTFRRQLLLHEGLHLQVGRISKSGAVTAYHAQVVTTCDDIITFIAWQPEHPQASQFSGSGAFSLLACGLMNTKAVCVLPPASMVSALRHSPVVFMMMFVTLARLPIDSSARSRRSSL